MKLKKTLGDAREIKCIQWTECWLAGVTLVYTLTKKYKAYSSLKPNLFLAQQVEARCGMSLKKI